MLRALYYKHGMPERPAWILIVRVRARSVLQTLIFLVPCAELSIRFFPSPGIHA